MLTKKQRDLLLFIHEHLQQGGVSPSFDEMKLALNLKSKSGIHRLISALEERGYIQRLPHRARALEVVRMPEGYQAMRGNSNFVPENSNNIPIRTQHPLHAAIKEIPLYGRIAAGTAIEAIRADSQTLSIPGELIGKGEHYALTVEGDSMINAGIHDKDTVIIKRCDTAQTGTIIVALIDDIEVTLKRLRRSGNKIILEPENDLYEPRVLEPSRVKVQGKLVSLMRVYQ